MMDFHQASEGTFLHHANWQHHQWLTSDLLTDENAGGITVEVILCKYSRRGRPEVKHVFCKRVPEEDPDQIQSSRFALSPDPFLPVTELLKRMRI